MKIFIQFFVLGPNRIHRQLRKRVENIKIERVFVDGLRLTDEKEVILDIYGLLHQSLKIESS